jgi:hypothetical protein
MVDLVLRFNQSINLTFHSASLSAHDFASRSNRGNTVAICAGVEAVVVTTIATDAGNIFEHGKNCNEKEGNDYYLVIGHFSFIFLIGLKGIRLLF